MVKKRITHEDYVEVLQSGKRLLRTMNLFRSSKHEIGTYCMNKIALSAEDDKRIIRKDGISTYAWGFSHFSPATKPPIQGFKVPEKGTQGGL